MDLLTSAENLCFRACSHYSIELPVVRLVLLGLVWWNGILLSEKSLLCTCYILYAFRHSRLLNWRQLKGIEDSSKELKTAIDAYDHLQYSLSRSTKEVDFYFFRKESCHQQQQRRRPPAAAGHPTKGDRGPPLCPCY